MNRNSSGKLVLLIALLVALVLPKTAFSASSLESLMQGVPSEKLQSGAYKVYVQGKEGATVLIVEEKTVGASLKIVHIWNVLVDLPKGTDVSPQMLKVIDQMNDGFAMGRVFSEKDNKNSTTSIYYQCDGLLSDMTNDGFKVDLAIAAFLGEEAKKQLKPLASGE